MNKNEAVITLLGNFAYYDGIIKSSEISKIKDIAKKRNISLNVDALIKKNIKDKTENLVAFAESMTILNKELSEKEKLSIVSDIVEVIKADGTMDEIEKYKISMLAVNWNITIKDSILK